MHKDAFLQQLRERLRALPTQDAEERVRFYSEMIDDRIEDGVDEEAAVADLGAMEDIVAQIYDEVPLHRLVRERIRPKRRFAIWELILLAVGSPLWLSLLAAVLAVAVSLLAVLVSVGVTLIAVEASLIGCTVGGIIGGAIVMAQGSLASGLLLCGAGVLCAGLGILLGAALRPMARWTCRSCRSCIRSFKHLFMKG